MRKVVLVASLLPIIMFVVACDSLSSSERLLVGKWYFSTDSFSQHDDDGDVFTDAEFETEYLEDKTSKAIINMRMQVVSKDRDFRETVVVTVAQKGTWSIEDKHLNENTTSVELKDISVEFEGDDLTDDVRELESAKESAKKWFYYDIFVPLKKESLGESSEKIVKLNNQNLVTVDEEGSKTEFKRIE